MIFFLCSKVKDFLSALRLAATTSFQVVYESPSQFSREYSRLFGAPPLRDIKNLHQISA
jgi:hypothetical protein